MYSEFYIIHYMHTAHLYMDLLLFDIYFAKVSNYFDGCMTGFVFDIEN